MSATASSLVQPLSYQLDTSKLQQLLEELRLPQQQRQKRAASHGIGLGLYTRLCVGINSATYKHPQVLQEILKLAPPQFPFLAIQINELQAGDKIALHRDFNLPESHNAVLLMGAYEGGHMWLESEDSPKGPPAAVVTEAKHNRQLLR